MKKLAIISTHPIQYNAPLFRTLHAAGKIEIKVFYTWSQSEQGTKYDPGFGKEITWDIPLLEGYPYQFVKNISKAPGSHHFNGIENPTLISEINKWNANAILIYGWSFKSHFRAMRYFHGRIPVFFRGDSTLLNDRAGYKSFIRRKILSFVYRYVDHALYAGIANKEYFLKSGLTESQLHFVPHSVVNDRFEPNDMLRSKAAQLRSDWKINHSESVFLFAGKLENNKNVELLISAFSEIKNENCYLIIAGSGPMEGILEEQAKSDQRIKFIGFQNQSMMPVLYNACDVYVLPSRSETWGLGINEAMAAGKAIICSDRCGCAEDLVETGVNGYVFAHSNLELLKEALGSLMKDGDKVRSFGKASKNKIESWDYKIAAERIQQIIMQVI